MEIKSGFYWIQAFSDSKWEVAEFKAFSNTWYRTGIEKDMKSPFRVNRTPVKMYEAQSNKMKAIELKLETMMLNDKFNRREFILEHWGDYDTHIGRSFDAMLSKLRKEKFPKRAFKSINGNLTRIL